MAQQNVFEDEVSVAPRKRQAAYRTRYVLKHSLRSGFDLYQLVQASERIE
jgi:hypothetical protein